nr:hypothetical protein GCM10020092_002720 [Actinoplanes digitatis]
MVDWRCGREADVTESGKDELPSAAAGVPVRDGADGDSEVSEPIGAGIGSGLAACDGDAVTSTGVA